MAAKIIDGKTIAAKVKEAVKGEVERLKGKGITPTLAVILVGDNPASQTYVRSKEKACNEVGINSKTIHMLADVHPEEVEKAVDALNADPQVHGILIQLPLPTQLSEKELIGRIDPRKDVDGLHAVNMGRLLRGDPVFVSCTPTGIMELIASTGTEIKGKEAVVIGRSNIVGKPIAILLMQSHATVTICHTRTQNLKFHTKRADILVAAAGKAKTVTKEMVKKGAIVIDVGISRTEKGLVGDVDFEAVKEVAGYITPVPGGVGPMTIAMLLKNTLKAAEIQSST